MKISIYPFLSFVWLLFFSLPYSGQLKSQELQPIKLQLKWQHQFQFAGYYAAQEKGYYRDAGLDVELLEGNAERPPIDRVLSGKVDFGVTGSDIISAYINHKPVVVVSVIFQHSPEVFMTLSDKKISSPSDLAGKKDMLYL